MRKMLLVIVSGLLLLAAAEASDMDSVTARFEEANARYEQKQYESAIETYESLLSGGDESAALYFNLGNAYFKTGDLGHAVLNYTRARRLDASDENIRHNLEFARQFARVRMEGVELNPISSQIEALVDGYRIEALAWLSSGVFILFILSLMMRYGLAMATGGMRAFMIVSLVLLVTSAALTTFKYRHDYLTRRAVIVADDAPVRTGASGSSDIELEGAPGLVVEILDESSDYVNVLFENKRRGWIRKDLVAEI